MWARDYLEVGSGTLAQNRVLQIALTKNARINCKYRYIIAQSAISLYHLVGKVDFVAEFPQERTPQTCSSL